MKKCLITLILLIILIPAIVSADVCDASKVKIIDVSVDNINGKVTETEDAAFLNKNMRLKLRFHEVGDYIIYSFKVKNESSDPFQLDEKSFDIDSDYITYELTTDDDDLVVKANSTKEFQLRISYSDAVPTAAFDNHQFQSSNVIQLNLSNDSMTENPKTGTIPTVIVISIVLALVIIFSLMNLKKQAYYVLIIGSILLIPEIYALCSLNVQVNVEYTISNNPMFCVTVDNDKTSYYEYEEGMTFDDYLVSSFNNEVFKLNDHANNRFVIYSSQESYGNCNGLKYSSNDFVNHDERIKNLDCYLYSSEYANIM